MRTGEQCACLGHAIFFTSLFLLLLFFFFFFFFFSLELFFLQTKWASFLCKTIPGRLHEVAIETDRETGEAARERNDDMGERVQSTSLKGKKKKKKKKEYLQIGQSKSN